MAESLPDTAADDPFLVLGLDPTADDHAVRAAYRAALLRYPPETDPEGFKRVRAAYERLRDPAVRASLVLFARPLVPGTAPTGPGDLGLPGLPTPQLEELLADLRLLVLAGSDLTRTRFPEDLRDPAGG